MGVVSFGIMVLIILLVILFFVSLTLFVRRLTINQSSRVDEMAKIEQKLDKIIELLEQKDANK